MTAPTAGHVPSTPVQDRGDWAMHDVLIETKTVTAPYEHDLYRAACTCGWKSAWLPVSFYADRMVDQHLAVKRKGKR